MENIPAERVGHRDIVGQASFVEWLAPIYTVECLLAFNENLKPFFLFS
jgi:hypothetical protein